MKFIKDLDWKTFGGGALKLVKKVGIEGSKAVILNGLGSIVKTGFDDGIEGIKQVKFDDLLSGKKASVTKRIFVEAAEEVVEYEEEEEYEFEDEEIEEIEVVEATEIIEPAPVKGSRR